MPRLSEQQRYELQFFIGRKGSLQYCGKCTNCIKDCKQSFRVFMFCCPSYVDRHQKSQKVTKNKPDQ